MLQTLMHLYGIRFILYIQWHINFDTFSVSFLLFKIKATPQSHLFVSYCHDGLPTVESSNFYQLKVVWMWMDIIIVKKAFTLLWFHFELNVHLHTLNFRSIYLSIFLVLLWVEKHPHPSKYISHYIRNIEKYCL